MNAPLDSPSSKPGKTLLSSFLLLFGGFTVITTMFGLCVNGFQWFFGFCGLALAVIFFALGRALDYLQETVQRLRRLEDRAREQNDQT